MRKIVFTISYLFTSYFGHSQIIFGVKSGINIATTKDLITFPKNRLGWYGGGFAIIPVYGNFFLQPELLYSSKGYRYIDLSDWKNVGMRLNYVDIPILLGYKIDYKTNILLGTDLAELIKATLDEKINATSSFPKKFDIGIAVGLSYKIEKQISAEVRYIFGLKDFYQTDAIGSRRGKSLAGNRVFQIGLSYNINK